MMNMKTQEHSYFKMIAEHQELSARALRLHALLNQHACVQHMPTEACTLINEMKNIIETGKPQPEGIESHFLNFDPNQLPFTDAETIVTHNFKIGDVVNVPSRMAQHKFIVSSKQRFTVKRFIGTDQLQLICIFGQADAWNGYNLEITGHYTHFAKIS